MEQKFWSVTSALSMLSKPALLGWSARTTAVAAVTSGHWLEVLHEQGEQEAIDWLANARLRASRTDGGPTAQAIGTEVHAAIEAYTGRGQLSMALSPEARSIMDQFERWFDHHQPKVICTEYTIFDPIHGYAGTADAVLEIDGVQYLVDYKTSMTGTNRFGLPTKPYPEVGLQLSAYRFAEGRLEGIKPYRYQYKGHRVYRYSDEEIANMTDNFTLDQALAIHITPNHCNAHLVASGNTLWHIFLHLVDILRATVHEFPNIVGGIVDNRL